MDKDLEKLVVIESPYRGGDYSETELNILYARACMRDALSRGEYPYASHLLFTQEGILDDRIEKERKLGIEAGFAWAKLAGKTAVYVDRGISRGVLEGIRRARRDGRVVEYRHLPNYSIWLEEVCRKINFCK